MDKFVNIDLIDALRTIMENNTINYKTDFNYDIDMFRRAARSSETHEKTFLWLSRPDGTQCYDEQQAFQQDTAAHNGWRFYNEQVKSDRILAYVVEVDKINMETGVVTGNLYELDYPKKRGRYAPSFIRNKNRKSCLFSVRSRKMLLQYKPPKRKMHRKNKTDWRYNRHG